MKKRTFNEISNNDSFYKRRINTLQEELRKKTLLNEKNEIYINEIKAQYQKKEKNYINEIESLKSNIRLLYEKNQSLNQKINTLQNDNKKLLKNIEENKESLKFEKKEKKKKKKKKQKMLLLSLIIQL